MNNVKTQVPQNGHSRVKVPLVEDEETTPLKVIFINSHPIQYYAPLYQYMNGQKGIDLTVLYCSKHGLSGELDEGFKVKVKWDIPLLEGYKSVFFKNFSPSPNVYNLWGLINFGIVPYLWKSEKSILIVHGWHYLTNLMAIVVGQLKGHVVCMRGDTPGRYEERRGWLMTRLRRLIFSHMLFPFIDYFLYVGKENKSFYKMYGVPEERLHFAPHAVDNGRFSANFDVLSVHKNEIKKELNLPVNKKVVLYVGKYMDVKRPMDLLRAYSKTQRRSDLCLVFVGEGELRPQMEQYIQELGLTDVFLTGFINQSQISKYYAAADVFVMCSESESWGLVVNEAMNFRLPLILSDLTSCSDDLLLEGENGYRFKTGNVEELAMLLNRMLDLSDKERRSMGLASQKRVLEYSYTNLTRGLEKMKPLLHS